MGKSFISITFILIVRIDELIEWVEVGGSGAVHIVPPVAYKVLLVEDGSIRAEEAVRVAIGLAHVKDLTISINISIDTRELLSTTLESSLRDGGKNREINSGSTRDGTHLTIWTCNSQSICLQNQSI